jgi:VanZ family protein
MKKHLSLRIIVIVLTTIAAVSFLLFFDFGRSDSRIIDTILSFGHLLLFGIAAIVTLWILNKGKWPSRGKNQYMWAWVIISSFGALTECIQAFIPYRHFRLGDILTDSLGAAVFLTLTYSFQKDVTHKGVTILRNGLLVLMIVRAYPIFIATVDTWNMKNDFPVLSSFEAPFEIPRWISKESTMQPSSLHATDGVYTLKVNLHPGIYPGISLDYFVEDWRGYNSLSFDVFIEGFSPLELSIRINDRKHNEEFMDRYNKSFLLRPGHNHISVSLSEVRRAPIGRLMDMANITVLCMFSYNLKEPRTVYFDNIRLEK